jgi:hypothetical protein
MLALAAVNAWWGAWARFAPRHFFDTFPGFGHQWTAAYPPYNQHLVTDLGATFLALAFLLAAGALVHSRTARWVVLAGVTVFNALHLSFHATHRGSLHTFDTAASLATLVLGVLVPVGLLAWDRASASHRDARKPRPDGDAAPGE